MKQNGSLFLFTYLDCFNLLIINNIKAIINKYYMEKSTAFVF